MYGGGRDGGCSGGCRSGGDLGTENPDSAPAGDAADPDVTIGAQCYRCSTRRATLLTRKASCRDCFVEVLRRNFASNLRTRCIKRVERAQSMIMLVGGDAFSTSMLHLLLDRNKRRYLRVSQIPEDSDVASRIFASDDLSVESVLSLDFHVGTVGSFAERSEAFFKHVTAVVNGVGNSSEACQPLPAVDTASERLLLGGVRLSHLPICYYLHEGATSCDQRCDALKGSLTRMYDGLLCDELAYSLDLLSTLNLRAYIQRRGLTGALVCACDTQEVIARRVMMLTCLGAGDRVAFRSAFVDDHSLAECGRIIRPMKAFSSKEVALYHRLSGLPALPSLDLYWHGSPQASILGCVNALISTVTSAHSSTLHNICNVVEKLVPDFPDRVSVCRVCGGAMYPSDAKGWSEELRSATRASLSTLCDSDYESFVDVLAFWEVFRLLLKADVLMSSCVKAFSGTRACGTRVDREFDVLLERGVAKGKTLFKDVYLVSQLLNHYVNPHKRVVPGTPSTAACAEGHNSDDDVGREHHALRNSDYPRSSAAGNGRASDSPVCGTCGVGALCHAATCATNYGVAPASKRDCSLADWDIFTKLLSGGDSRPRMMPLYNKIPFLSLGNFVFFYRINEGSSGKVHVGFHKSHRRTYALKVISKSQFNCDRALFRRLKDEMSLVTALGHPNIVRTFELLETVSTIVIAMEYCDGGDMIGLIKEYSPMAEPMARAIFRMVVAGVHYLHSSDICHRDIKPENIFLKRVAPRSFGQVASISGKGSHAVGAYEPHAIQYGMMPYIVKIGDFGAATRINDNRALLETVGTMSYAAPEVLGCGGVTGYNGKSADIWSLGVLLYAMLFGELPWHNEDFGLREAVKQILDKPLTFPCQTSSTSRDLMSSMLRIEPADRPTIEGVMAHQWLAEGNVDAPLVLKKIRPTLSKPE
ncbi:protein kinase domain containing protein, putative [Babesia bigemina]|uniref:Protein kinase domain containing protein, putative n=1 Tax=Babesia bigemina TaxID=5866 RepID=A0A061D9A8_BABBI|nr:protein kinase domain containing protein, putative [Babesia bigemina]CDR96572.1 protein kinase domain containing protein, putative [Babesia bigemina]|eukprot:XP_012768758.1 protein kinase domain containing protein, putative [Babesia bigemina]